MIVFTRISWRNLLSTGNVDTVLNLNDAKSTLIVGHNGAGKSTLLDAITYALFGKPFRDVNKPQLVNTITQKGLLVELDFKIGSIEYKVRRGQKPNIFEVFQDGELIKPNAERPDQQAEFERNVLKMSYSTFCQVFMTGTANYKPFMALTAKERRDTVEEFLDLKIFTSMNKILKKRIEAAAEEDKRITTERRVIKDKIELVKKHFASIQQNTQKMLEEKKERILDARKQILALADEIKEYQRTRDELSEIASEHGAVAKKITQLRKLTSQLEIKMIEAERQINFFNDHTSCPTCQQEIDEAFKCDAVNARTEDANKFKDAIAELDTQRTALEQKLASIRIAETKLQALTVDIHGCQMKIDSLESYIQSLSEEAKTIKENTITDDKEQIDALNQQLLAYEDAYNKNFELVRHLNIVTYMLKDNAIKAQIVKQYVPIINQLVNKYLAELDFYCQFEFDENFKETIKSRYRDEFTYGSFSQGEKQRIDFAIMWSWRAIAMMRNSVATNLLIMDEAMDSSMDQNGVEELLKIVKKLTNENIIIISHKADMISDHFDRTIKFEKVKNFSKMVIKE